MRLNCYIYIIDVISADGMIEKAIRFLCGLRGMLNGGNGIQ